MIFVFDLETIPDGPLLSEILDQPDADLAELRKKGGEQLARNQEEFLPPMYHQMVAWTGLWIDPTGQPRQKQGWHGSNEKEGLELLFQTLLTYKDFSLTHHNGRSFDLPLLLYRSMKYQLQMPMRLNKRDITYRYSDHNTDLKETLSNFGASSWPKLAHLAALVGFPAKQVARGDQVLELYEQNELERIERYCHEDVMSAYLIWLHYKHAIGDISADFFANLRERALAKLEEIQEG
ncbi:MAG: ribonuclease H-like domain-containing protein [Bacteroidota bacterium]